VVLFGENEPDPRVVHTPEPVVDVPDNGVLGDEMQVSIVSPATTYGASVNVTSNESTVAKHVPLPVEVR
jgi:hypothetical protein